MEDKKRAATTWNASNDAAKKTRWQRKTFAVAADIFLKCHFLTAFHWIAFLHQQRNPSRSAILPWPEKWLRVDQVVLWLGNVSTRWRVAGSARRCWRGEHPHLELIRWPFCHVGRTCLCCPESWHETFSLQNVASSEECFPPADSREMVLWQSHVMPLSPWNIQQ